MKACIFVVLLFLVNLLIAQNDKKIKRGTPINSGFVFIDGKYIEPPYKFSFKKGNIYINGIQASILKASTTTEKKKKIQKVKKKHIEPIFNLDKNLGWYEFLSMINPLTGNKYYTDYKNYVFKKHHPSKEEYEKFIRTLPFVKSYEDGYLRAYNGKTYIHIYVHRKKPLTNKQHKKFNKEELYIDQKVLSRGGTIVYFKTNLPKIIRGDTLRTIELLEDLYKNTDSIDWNYLHEKSIYSRTVRKEKMIELLQEIKNNQKLRQRFENVKKNFSKLNSSYINETKTNELPIQKNKSFTSFSPKENTVTYFCPYAFDEVFSDYYNIIQVFEDELNDYNYLVNFYDVIDDDYLVVSLKQNNQLIVNNLLIILALFHNM